MTILSFESCKLHLQARQLVVGDQVIDLQPLVFDLLAYLANNPRRVVRRDELLQAVWRSSHVSDSVVARAVMKCRRAIQDSAASPRWLHTLHGRGYRLDVDVSLEDEPSALAPCIPEPSAMLGALAVLPCRNRTGDSGLDWISLGLAGLIHHLLGQSKALKLVPMAATAALWRTLDAGDDVLQATCHALDVPEALVCELTRYAQGWQLTSWRGASMLNATESRLYAADIGQLATRLTEVVTGDQVAAEALPADPFWREQLAQSIGLFEAGNPRQALELLSSCEPHLRPSAHLSLLKCSMLYRSAQPEASMGVAAQALQLACSEGSLVMEVRARFAMAYALHDLGRMEEAVEQAKAALQLTDQSPEAFVMRPTVLCCLARTVMQQGHTPLAAKLIEEALGLSKELGQLDAEAEALMWSGFLFGRMGHARRASADVERALQLAQRSGDPGRQATVLRAQAVVLQWQMQLGAALDACRRSVALWTRSGNQVGRNWAKVQILELMAEAGEGAFDAEHQKLNEQPGLTAGMLTSATCSRAIWLWKQGQQGSAVDTLSALSRGIDPAARLLRNVVGEELVFMLAQGGETEKAKQEFALLPQADRPIRRARSQAALALSAGDAVSALRCLRATWESKDGYGPGAADLLADLGWLLLEQWSPGDRVDELESLYAHALDSPGDYLPSAVFRASWRLRRAPNAEHTAQWDATMRLASNRLRQFAWITEPAYRDQLAHDQPRRLKVLLTRAFA